MTRSRLSYFAQPPSWAKPVAQRKDRITRTFLLAEAYARTQNKQWEGLTAARYNYARGVITDAVALSILKGYVGQKLYDQFLREAGEDNNGNGKKG